MRDALRRGMGDIRYPEIRENFDQRIATGEFQKVEPLKHASGRQFTTPETIAMERKAVGKIQLGQGTIQPIMPAEKAAKHAEKRPDLNEGQRRAIREVLSSEDRVHGFQGLAGTGKTTTLASIRDGAEKNGYAVQGFAPTSKAASQLREAGISADTLQGYLARGGERQQTAGDPNSRHLFMLDEPSLSSTRQMRDFLEKIGPQDRVLLVGDTRQHQGVEAGKPFEQMQDAGMRTAKLEKIMRQKDPELLRAVEHLSRNETAVGISLLQQQGRVSEIPDAEHRIRAIAKEYAKQPAATIIVSPDNASRREINAAVRTELQTAGVVSRNEEHLATLIPRAELTGADRQWAQKYNLGDILHYSKGSKELEIKRGTYAAVVAVDPKENRITVSQGGREITYDPKRLQGISAYQEINRDFAKGDRIQFTAPIRELGIANRELATIEKITDSEMKVRIDGEGKRSLTFNAQDMRHFDHGYAVTSHSSQSATAERVLINMDTKKHAELINPRFAYVSVSRASHDAQIFTNDAQTLGQRLSHDVTKTSAVEFRQAPSISEESQAREQRNAPAFEMSL